MLRCVPLCALAAILAVGCSPSEKPTAAPSKQVTDAKVAMPTETGDGPAEKDLPKAIDLPLYPGSKVTHNKKTSNGGYHVSLETKDSPKQAAAFYQAHGLTGALQGDTAQLLGQTKHGDYVIIDITRAKDTTTIAIKESPGAEHG